MHRADAGRQLFLNRRTLGLATPHKVRCTQGSRCTLQSPSKITQIQFE